MKAQANSIVSELLSGFGNAGIGMMAHGLSQPGENGSVVGNRRYIFSRRSQALALHRAK